MSGSDTSIARNLEALTDGAQERVCVGDIVQKVEVTGGLAPVLFVLTLPVLLPLPPGFSIVLALPLLAAAPQMMLGRRVLWMPAWLAGRSMQRDKLDAAIARILPWLRKAEALVHPRLTFVTGRTGAMVVGAVCTLLAVVLILPLPFANLLPALTVLLFCMGLARRDGLVVLLGFVAVAVSIAGIVWGAHGLRLLWDWWRATF